MMVYDVTYRVGQEERTDRVIAPHAAGAAERIRKSYEDGDEQYELLLVTLVEEPERRPAAAD
jgi:hypothetical protein